MAARSGAAARPQTGRRNLGARIKIVGGNFEGEWGWLDSDKAETKLSTYVYIGKEDKSRRVLTKNVVNIEIFDSKTGSGAIMKQYPEVWSQMNELCKYMAMCHVQSKHTVEFTKLFAATLQDTVETHRSDPNSSYYAEPEVKTDSKKRK